MNASRSAIAAQNRAILRIEGKKRNISSSTFTLIAATHSSSTPTLSQSAFVAVADLIVLLQATNMAITIVSDKLRGSAKDRKWSPLAICSPEEETSKMYVKLSPSEIKSI